MGGEKEAFRGVWWASIVPMCGPKRNISGQLVRQLEAKIGPNRAGNRGEQRGTCLNLWRYLRKFCHQFYKVLANFWPVFSSSETF